METSKVKFDALLLEDLSGKTTEEALTSLSSDFEEPRESMGVARLLIAYVSVGAYGCDSSAYVLYVGVDGLLYEVHGSHCSCHGFEGQWEPTVVTGKYLVSDKFSFSTGGYDDNNGSNSTSVRGRIRELFNEDGALVA